MEKRAILAAVLMAAVFLVYQIFFFPEQPRRRSLPPQTGNQPPAARPRGAAPAAPPPAAPAPVPGSRRAPRPPQRLVTVEAPSIGRWSAARGGKLQELTLKYRGEKPMVIVGDLGQRGSSCRRRRACALRRCRWH